MTKIGLIGAENSHTHGFCESIAGGQKYPGFDITHVYGGDSPKACSVLVEKFGLTECASEEEIINICDAFIITYRKGSMHYDAVMKVLKAGKPMFNDKPFTTELAKAVEIVEYAKKNNILICGGSTIKNYSGLGKVKQKIKPGSTVVISFSADPESPYDGFWFYGIHSVEACIKLLGEDFKSVSAFRTGNNIVAAVGYGDKNCVITTSPDSDGMNISIINAGLAESFLVNADPGVNTAADDLINMLTNNALPLDNSFYVAAIKLMVEIMASAGI